MPRRNVISDWNGTLFAPVNDEAQNKAIAYAALVDATAALRRGRLWRIVDLFGLLKTRRLLQQRIAEHAAGRRHLWEVYQPFNDGVLKRLPVARITAAVDEYAAAAAGLVDHRMLRPIGEAKRAGARTGILSVSYDYAIGRILAAAGCAELFAPADVISNRLVQRGELAEGFTLEIYEQKRQVFEDVFLRDRGFAAEHTYYAGDRLDDDGPVASLLPPGHFIVPFMASDGVKQAFAAQHQAFVPEDEEDLRRFFAAR